MKRFLIISLIMMYFCFIKNVAFGESMHGFVGIGAEFGGSYSISSADVMKPTGMGATSSPAPGFSMTFEGYKSFPKNERLFMGAGVNLQVYRDLFRGAASNFHFIPVYVLFKAVSEENLFGVMKFGWNYFNQNEEGLEAIEHKKSGTFYYEVGGGFIVKNKNSNQSFQFELGYGVNNAIIYYDEEPDTLEYFIAYSKFHLSVGSLF